MVAMFFKLYALAIAIFFAIDMLWLGVIAKNLYSKYVGYLMASQINWLAAILFYLLFIAGLVVFVLIPGIKSESLNNLILHALLFGLVTYATYDLTNLATIKNWPLVITVIDLIWGMTLSTIVSLLTYLIARQLGIK